MKHRDTTEAVTDASGADRQPDLLEFLQIGVPGLGHRPTQTTDEVQRTERIVGRTREDPVEASDGRRRRPAGVVPRGTEGCAAADGQYQPPPGASADTASGAPSTAASAPQAMALARSPEVRMSPSAMTWT